MRSVFISYRRGDSEGQARSLNFDLVERIGKDAVFMDVDSIALGQDFRHILRERLDSCDLMLALIGPGWLDAKDAAGNRRLESATDLVRQEIAAALQKNIPVTPVLLQGAQMPLPERLPDDIKDLVYRNGFELGHSTWESDVSEMVRRLGLDKTSATPTHGPVGPDANSTASAVSGPFNTSWVPATLVVIAVVAGMFFYQKAHDQSSNSDSDTSIQQPIGSSPQQPAASSPQQLAGSPSQQPAGSRGGAAAAFDQQPVEAGTVTSACVTAYGATGDERWMEHGARAFDWFLGQNVLQQWLYDPSTGGCRDGLHSDRVNRNQGAEATLSFLLALCEMRAAYRPESQAAPALALRLST